MSRQRRNLLLWLLTTAISVPLGWWAARPLAQPGSDLVWATLSLGPPWVVFRLVTGGFRWNAYFFGFLPVVFAFESLAAPGVGFLQAAFVVALAPLVAYAILGFTSGIMFPGSWTARIAPELDCADGDAASLPDRLGRRLRSIFGSVVRWYVIWLFGAAVGFGLALATETLVRSSAVRSEGLQVALISRAAVGVVAGGLAWILLPWSRVSPPAPDRSR
jgi:hypothetical protein